jgi:adenine-specific DNA methylase
VNNSEEAEREGDDDVWKRFSSLPAYFGGKRRLIGKIFKHLPPPGRAPVLVDAFLGGGSISLFAKARGYRVICNDCALRSHIVGRALIENDRVKLTREDLTRLFTPVDNQPHFIEEHFAPDVVTTKHARFLDLAFVNARAAPGVKKWLLLLLLIKYILRMRPMGNFGAKTIIHQAEAGAWEQMNPNYVKDLLSRNICGHPKRVAEVLRKQVNRGVFSNGQVNEAHQGDVFEFLGQAQGDILYLDPPYAGTSSYETSLKALDSMLAGRQLVLDKSVFSKAGALEWLERLFEASRQFPTWVLSYGNSEANLEEVVKLVEKFKRVTVAEAFRYTHLTGLSSQEHRDRNRELLIVAEGTR